MRSSILNKIITAAREHKANLTADINNASTRLETVRLTALAQEASNLVTDLENLALTDETPED